MISGKFVNMVTQGSDGIATVDGTVVIGENNDHQGGNDATVVIMETQDDDNAGDNELRIRQYPTNNNGPFVVCIRVRDADKQPLESVRLTKFIRDRYRSAITIRQVNEFKMRVTFSPKMKPAQSTSVAPNQEPTPDEIAAARNDANALPKVEEWNKKYRVYIPEKLVESIGCISFSVKNDITELKTNGCGKFKNSSIPSVTVLDASRFTKAVDSSRVDTSTVRVTFEGLLLPDHVNLFGLLIPVREFKRRQMFCKLCLRYNHTETHCVNKPQQQTQEGVWCAQCKSTNHSSGDKTCARRKQLEHRDRINSKITRHKTYAEMLQQYDPSNVMPGENTQENFPALDLGTKRKRNQIRTNQHETPRYSPVKKRTRDFAPNTETPIGFRNPNVNDESDDHDDDEITTFLKSLISDLQLPPVITQLIVKFILPIINKFVKKITNSLMVKMSQFGV